MELIEKERLALSIVEILRRTHPTEDPAFIFFVYMKIWGGLDVVRQVLLENMEQFFAEGRSSEDYRWLGRSMPDEILQQMYAEVSSEASEAASA
jgi:hypothetical protein